MKKLTSTFNVFTFCIMTMLLFILAAHLPLVSVANASDGGSMMTALESVKKFLADNSMMIGSVGAIIFGVIKAVSNSKAEVASNFILRGIAYIQGKWDFLPKMISMLGEILLGICNIIAKILKSDGIGGAK